LNLASIVRALALSSVATLLSTSALAQDPAEYEEPAPEEHTGFFLQGGTGIGYISSSYDHGVPLSMYGISALVDFGVGYSVAPGLALHGSLFGGIVISPTVDIDGDELQTTGDTDFTLAALGAGITYFTPINLYISAGTGVGFATLQNERFEASLKPGLALKLKVGYEWLLTRQLGLGAALQAVYFRNAEKDLEGHWTSIGGGPMVSLTFN
jgi:hypothetical protein